VIIDEAHSSQSGESSKHLKAVLSAAQLDEAAREEAGDPEDYEDRIVAEMRHRGRLPNLSFFAFTATPKPKTLELFGKQQPDGSFAPFSLYSMRQAIEEGFILDVLENYTTYKTYFNLLKKIEDDPSYDRDKAIYLLRSFVDLHDHAINKKIEVMVEHFVENSYPRINGRAKAMIVTRSRLHAVRYKLAIDRYLRERGYPFEALVAFSGTVHDGGEEYTEYNMNHLPERQTAETFKQDKYRILIVANKFQTGFDQPLLHTMYVDKKLGGVNAVQTLSRLNRVHPAKTETMVLDFANEAEEIQKAFQPYYEKTFLTEATDPNLLHDLELRLADFDLFEQEEVEQFARFYFVDTPQQPKLYAVLRPVEERFKGIPGEAQVEFRSSLGEYVRLYAFLSQIIPFKDAELEKLYAFGRHLLRVLPVSEDRLPVEIREKIDMESYRIQQRFAGTIELERGSEGLAPKSATGPDVPRPDEIEHLSKIIEELNDRFGTEFNDEDRVFIEQLENKLAEDRVLDNAFRVNTPENAKLVFISVANDHIQDMIDSNFRFYKQITDDHDFGQYFMSLLFDRFYQNRSLE
jgi:type I restriction enzyme, R subunit